MRWTFIFAGVIEGIWMLIDALQLLRRSPGRFSSDELWSRTAVRLGLDPVNLVPVFLVLGILWIAVTVGIATRRLRDRRIAVILACVSLWYAIPGTVLALIFLFALWTIRADAGAAGGRASETQR